MIWLSKLELIFHRFFFNIKFTKKNLILSFANFGSLSFSFFSDDDDHAFVNKYYRNKRNTFPNKDEMHYIYFIKKF